MRETRPSRVIDLPLGTFDARSRTQTIHVPNAYPPREVEAEFVIGAEQTKLYETGDADPFMTLPGLVSHDMIRGAVLGWDMGLLRGEKTGMEKLRRELRSLLGTPGRDEVEPRTAVFGG